MRSTARWMMTLCLLCGMASTRAYAGEADGKLDIYFIDVEGGAATLVVTPAGESILIDSGYPDNGGRDLGRILHVVKDVAGLKKINHAVVSHWHLDHFGNHASLAGSLPIENFWDRGIPDMLAEDPEFGERIAKYKAACNNHSQTLKAGDRHELDSPQTPLSIEVVTGSRKVIANTGKPNPFAAEHKPQPVDPSDNAASLSFVMQFGKFRFLCCGDLTWNTEAELVTPNNPLGHIDLFMVTHHGLNVSNNPVLVKAIDPVVSVCCNGPTKGGAKETIDTLRACKSLKAMYQLHRNVALKDDEQAPKEFIANTEPTVNCSGQWIKASVLPGGESFTVQIGADGEQRTYRCQ